MEHRLNCSEPGGIFSDQGLNLCSALAGGFFTSEPPGKPLSHLLFCKENLGNVVT